MNDDKIVYKNKDYYYELSDKKIEVVEEHLNTSAKLHFHDYLEAELILGGDATQYINDYKTFLKKGSFSLLRPSIDCHSLIIENLDVIKCYVKPFEIDETLWKEVLILLDPLVVEFTTEEFEQAINLFNIIRNEQSHDEKYSNIITKNAIDSLICMFIKKKTENEENINVKKNIISYLIDNDRYLTDVSLQDFADDFGYSLSHASKYFKENTGMNFSDAKQFFRIQNAKRLLLSTDLPISKISEMCGFNYYHLFHKVFKKSTGLTPFEFKKNNI